jgi:catechol 2,3-dioxygenase-like lactoylglutathione lyase family enzyme
VLRPSRPFKIVRMGPIRFFVEDVEKAQEFYREVLGLRPRNEVFWDGHRCAVLGAGTEHHSIGLYPLALRDKLGIRTGTSTMALGMQVATYRQLLDARAFLRAEGFAELEIPAELHPGIKYAFHAVDPDGNAVELYAHMEQVLPAHASGQRPVSASSKWPDVIDDDGTAFLGEAFLGPWE